MLPTKKTENTEASSDEIYRQYIREQQKKWRDSNPDRVRDAQLKHKPPVSELTPKQLKKRRSDQRKCYHKRMERLREHQRQLAKDNPEKTAEKVAEKEARRRHTPISELPPEQAAMQRAKTKAYYEKNRERILAYKKNYKINLKKEMTERKKMVESSIVARFNKST